MVKTSQAVERAAKGLLRAKSPQKALYILLTLVVTLVITYFQQEQLSGSITKLRDGDSFLLGEQEIRLYGIDAPELHQNCTMEKLRWACGKEAKAYLSNLVSNKTVECTTKDTDRYNRKVSVCFVEENGKRAVINELMVANGWAMAYTQYGDDYAALEKAARSNKLGIWKGTIQPPWEWRKSQKGY